MIFGWPKAALAINISQIWDEETIDAIQLDSVGRWSAFNYICCCIITSADNSFNQSVYQPTMLQCTAIWGIHLALFKSNLVFIGYFIVRLFYYVDH